MVKIVLFSIVLVNIVIVSLLTMKVKLDVSEEIFNGNGLFVNVCFAIILLSAFYFIELYKIILVLVVAISFEIVLILLIFLIIVIYGYMNYYLIDKSVCSFIVLGCRLDSRGNCSNILKKRLDKAIRIHRKNDMAVIVLSGGSAHNSFYECFGMQEYLLEKGVQKRNIFLESKSKNTYENLRNSYKLISRMNLQDNKIYYITSDFHIPRSYIYSRKLGLKLFPISSISPNIRASIKNYKNEVIKVLLLYRYCVISVIFISTTIILFFMIII